MSPQFIVSVVAVCVALLGMISAAALGTLGLLITLAVISATYDVDDVSILDLLP